MKPVKPVKRPKGKSVMECINFNFGKKHYIVAGTQGAFKFFGLFGLMC